MKLPVISFQDIKIMAERAEAAVYSSGSRVADVHIIENAIRNALAIYTEKLDIQMKQHYFVDLGKS